MPESNFERLAEPIRRWIYQRGWSGLRDAQEQAIPAVLDTERDLIISAATAAGKTEAAFLPILSRLLEPLWEGASVLYVSPLVALINDQWGRLTDLCESLDVRVVPWHGDISAGVKAKFLKRPSGVLLITPESLEALFVLRGFKAPTFFARLAYFVVDELHSFIGAERGKQLQSLMNRVELAAGRRVPRIGLSATLGDMGLAADYLRPGLGQEVQVIKSAQGAQELKIQLRGYVAGSTATDLPLGDQADPALSALHSVAEHIFSTTRDSNNLVFPNSRNRVEFLSDALRRRCEREGIPNQYWPHHGSLAKEVREETERELKSGDRPATAICTTTLELGVDIGSVKAIAQVGPPPSVASLRQRLGRSGRRAGEPAILRAYSIEQELNEKAGLSDKLRESLVQSVASINLLLRGWCEPPRAGAMNLSTLVQQVLSVICERGGASAQTLYDILIRRGPFADVSISDFKALLSEMGNHDLLTQEASGLLLPGGLGERLTGHYTFYAAFTSKEEWTLEHSGRPIGRLPIDGPVMVGLRMIMAGLRWQVVAIDEPGKVLVVQPDPGGMPPRFDSAAGTVDDGVRQEMRRVLAGGERYPYMDTKAAELLEQGREFYRRADLDRQALLGHGNSFALFTWRGDPVSNALALILAALGAPEAASFGVFVHIGGWTLERIQDALLDISRYQIDQLPLDNLKNLAQEKWDWALPPELLLRSYVRSHLDLEGAVAIASKLRGA